MPDDALLTPLLNSPRLPQYLDRINAVLEEERIRRAQFHRAIDQPGTFEFINGELIKLPPMPLRHHKAANNLFMLLDTFAGKHNLGDAGCGGYLINLSRNDYDPDVVFWNRACSSQFTPDQFLFPAPDFIAEVLDHTTESRDRGAKFEDYAAHGVGEYWIIDADAKTVEKYTLAAGHYQLAVQVNSGTIRSNMIDGFEISVLAIFEEEPNLTELSRILTNGGANRASH